MTVKKIFELGLINDDAEIYIRDAEMHVLTHGNWYQDNILEYLDRKVECFTWQDNGEFFIDLLMEV